MSGREPHEIIREARDVLLNRSTTWGMRLEAAADLHAALDALVAHVNELQQGLSEARDDLREVIAANEKIITECDAERARAERAETALRAHEFVYMPEVSGDGDHCPSCGQTPEEGHHAECRLAAALAAVPVPPRDEESSE